MDYGHLTEDDPRKTKILVIDEESGVRRYLRVSLEAHGFDVYEAETLQRTIELVNDTHPDVVLLDLQVSGIGMIEAIHTTLPVPIIALSTHDEDSWKIEALDSGADDYIVKPFSIGELLARVRVALRHARAVNYSDVFVSGTLKVDFIRRIVLVEDKIISLTPTEYDLLYFLIRHVDRPVTHEQLWRGIRGQIKDFDIHKVRIHMSNLRHKLEEDPAHPHYIVTESGVGYRLQTSDTSTPV